MKLFRYGEPGQERPGVVGPDGRLHDASSWVADWHGSALSPDLLAQCSTRSLDGLPVLPPDVALAPCVGGIGNVICIGLNYADHAAEAGLPKPGQPIVFNKHSGAVAPPVGPLWCPPGAQKLDWEVELGVVIGRTAWHVPEAQALAHVAGYCLLNDVSERDYQMAYEGQWTKGKSYPTHCPIGPWLVTPDELQDPQNVDLWLSVNDVPRQRGNTRTMIFGVAHIISYLSRFMALQPGDLIATGTPPGVGMGSKPPVFLQAGDVVTLGSPELGQQRQWVEASPGTWTGL